MTLRQASGPLHGTVAVRLINVPKISDRGTSTMLILNAKEVQQSLPMSQAVAAMKEAFAALQSGRAIVPPRGHLESPAQDGITLVMPARVDDLAIESGSGPHEGVSALTVKVVSVFSRNAERGERRINAAVLILDPETGIPIAMLEGATLTAIRTAAASGAATDLLARPDAHQLAILGAGVEARTHICAVCAVRPVQAVRVYSPTRSNVEALVEEMSADETVSVKISAADSPADAVRDADVVCTVTTSTTPVFSDGDLAERVHINAVGSFKPHVVEVPAETVCRARVFVDSREAAWDEAGDLIQPLEAGLITKDHILAEMGELVEQASRGDLLSGGNGVTLFKSVGVAVQDSVAAAVALRNAKQLSLGQTVEW
jgi:ornithine cyclodeaminase/alanine dehydrogenase-like protein (mu-crystallin family)